MNHKSKNHYETAFENWLKDNRIKYTTIDQSKRTSLDEIRLKSFDYILYPPDNPTLICELKGRTFKGVSFENLTGLECWIQAADIEGLLHWQKEFGGESTAYIIFAYRIENVDVDFDGREVFEIDGQRYLFFAVKLDDYKEKMKLRSPKWKTVTLGADNFRKSVTGLENLLLYS